MSDVFGPRIETMSRTQQRLLDEMFGNCTILHERSNTDYIKKLVDYLYKISSLDEPNEIFSEPSEKPESSCQVSEEGQEIILSTSETRFNRILNKVFPNDPLVHQKEGKIVLGDMIVSYLENMLNMSESTEQTTDSDKSTVKYNYFEENSTQGNDDQSS